MRDRDRHRRGDKIGAVAGYDKVNLVDIEQLGVDARHCRGVALVVIVDQLDRLAQQPTLLIDIVPPDLHCKQGRLAGGSKPAGQPHAEADRDRLRRLDCASYSGAAGQCRSQKAKTPSPMKRKPLLVEQLFLP